MHRDYNKEYQPNDDPYFEEDFDSTGRIIHDLVAKKSHCGNHSTPEKRNMTIN